MFESDAGRTCSGNARAISDQLHRSHPGVAQAWAYRTQPERIPDFAEPVERLGIRHAWLLARARYRVDDGASSMAGRKPRGAVWTLSGSGVPVHRLGLDDPSVLVSRGGPREVRRRSRRWDLVVAASRFDADVTSRALGYAGQVVEAGLPRMDVAVAVRAGGADVIAAQRKALDLPADRPVIMYAPAPREGDRQPRAPRVDLDRWAQSLGHVVYLLVRPHPSERFTVPTRLRHAVRDIGEMDDLGGHLAASDLLVSDYSSIIGDAALADLPVLLFQPDREAYVNRTRGVYPGLDSVGPCAHDTDALIAMVGSWLADPMAWDGRYAGPRRVFAAERCGPADGRAAERAVAA